MKIKPPKHTIITTGTVNKDIDIPLAYIGQDSSDYNVTLSGFEQESREIVMPYDKFDSMDVKLFDGNGNEIRNEDVFHRIRNTNQYYFMPGNYRSFVPQKFEYWVTAKKNMQYRLDKIYDISVGCESEEMMEQLVALSNSSMKPHNVYVNSNETFAQKYLDGINYKDITFISSPDGEHYSDGTTSIDYNVYMDNCTNLWISCDKYNYRDFETEADMTAIFDGKNENCTCSPIKIEYLANGFLSGLQYTLVSGGTIMPVVVAETAKGFIVISHSSFLENSSNNSQMFFDVMSYVFRNARVKSENFPAWVADSVPDYVIENSKAVHYDKIFYDISIPKLFGIEQSEAVVTGVFTNAANVLVNDMTATKVAFSKSRDATYASYKDPYFGIGGSTVYIPNGQIVYYSNFVYKIKSGLEQMTSFVKKTDSVILKIKPFKDSLAGINIKEQTTLTIDFPSVTSSEEYAVYVLNGIARSIKSDKYDGTGKCLFYVSVDRVYADNTVYDIRTRGGGSTTENFNLLNIGNMSGRPYRKAGSYIITLPAKYKQYDAYIKEAVGQHCSSSDMPIILYKEE